MHDEIAMRIARPRRRLVRRARREREVEPLRCRTSASIGSPSTNSIVKYGAPSSATPPSSSFAMFGCCSRASMSRSRRNRSRSSDASINSARTSFSATCCAEVAVGALARDTPGPCRRHRSRAGSPRPDAFTVAVRGRRRSATHAIQALRQPPTSRMSAAACGGAAASEFVEQSRVVAQRSATQARARRPARRALRGTTALRAASARARHTLAAPRTSPTQERAREFPVAPHGALVTIGLVGDLVEREAGEKMPLD